MRYKKQSAFTLLELSIVIVIIGLIVAGISAGQSLVKQANMRSTLASINELRTAINTFSLQYNELPGDIPNASSYFTCATDGVVAGNTCNGDGDGRIIYYTPTNTSLREGWRAHEHLRLAGILEGNMTAPGIVADASNVLGSIIGVNTPEVPFANTGIALGAANSLPYKALFYLGAFSTNYSVIGAAFTHPEAYAIDKKLDDANPTSGIITPWGNVTCRSSSITEYDLSIDTPDCSLRFNH